MVHQDEHIRSIVQQIRMARKGATKMVDAALSQWANISACWTSTVNEGGYLPWWKNRFNAWTSMPLKPTSMGARNTFMPSLYAGLKKRSETFKG